MSSSIPGNDVEVEGRFVQLEVGPDGQQKKSNSFYLGWWRWQITVHRANKSTWLTLWPCSKWDGVAASVSLKFTFFPKGRPVVIHYVREVEASINQSNTWSVVDGCVSRSCLVEIKFVGINAYGKTDPALVTTPMQTTSREQAQSGVVDMLREGILTDITINAVGGSIRAHRAVLAARSPVFLSMFSHDLREKELSAVDSPDMSIAVCRAFVGYLYSAATSEEELLAHRSELVAAGDKYGVENLKAACEESLREDVGAENMLERLRMAHTYVLPALKRTCVRLLVDFGMMYEILKGFVEFTETGDPDLVGEIKRLAAYHGRKFPQKQKSAAEKASANKARRPIVRNSTPRQASGTTPAKRARKATPSQASGTTPSKQARKYTPRQALGSIPAKRARGANVRLAGDEWHTVLSARSPAKKKKL
ncbi:unnamed protein product [Alopecurus aequalis]